MKRFGRREAGDTIVEVLIAIVLVATILGGAYATANHSALDVREAQEHGEALNIAEGQLESLRGLALNSTLADPGAIFTDQDIFCIVPIGTTPTPEQAVNDSSNNPVAVGSMPAISQDNDGVYTLLCKQNSQNVGYSYDVAIDRCSALNGASDLGTGSCTNFASEPANSALFIVHIRWDGLTSVRDEVTLEYRLYEAHT
jgi:type II secretory pathway pseudopilin PulG